MINLKGISAKQCCEMILKENWPLVLGSECIKSRIEMYGGKCFKVSNVERRLRESDNVLSFKVPGKNYVKYSYIGVR